MGNSDLEPGEVRLDREEERYSARSDDRSKDRRKERDRDRHDDHGKDRRKEERHRDKESIKDRDRERDRDREKDGRDGSNKHREKEKDRGKDREKERERDRGKEREKERDREKEKEKEKSRNREKERDKEKDREKERERNKEKSREKEREKSLEREKVNSKEKDREASREIEKRDGDGADQSKTSEIREKIVKMKEERMKEKTEDDLEILSWVSKSRKLEEKRNAEVAKAQLLSKALEEQDELLAGSDDEDDETGGPGRDHLGGGVKILHGLDKVMEGGAVVLTLKDQNILAGGDVNEGADMLENVEIGEQKNRDELYRAAKKKTGVYYDKFTEDMESRKPILPQYDDPVKDEGVMLDESGRFSAEAEKKLEELRRRISGGLTVKLTQDLATGPTKPVSDYYTEEEMLQFKKPKKKKSLRKKEKLDLDALEAEAIAAGLGASDRGSRRDPTRLTAREEKEREEALARSETYRSAIAKAEQASKALREEQTLTVTLNAGEEEREGEEMVFGDDYEDLQRSLGEARKLAIDIGKEDREGGNVMGPQKVALLASSMVNSINNRGTEGNGDAEMEGGEREEGGGKVVITEMEEFLWGHQLNEETRKPETEDVFMDMDEDSEPAEKDKNADISGWEEVKDTVNTTSTDPTNENAGEKKDEIAPDEIIREVAVGKGLGAALKLLKERGSLNEGIDWGGRTMDKKKSKLIGIVDDNNEPKEKEIRIERTDEFGRILTPKEAFRIISHKFHGKGPGKTKQEKKLKGFNDDLKTKQMKASDTPLMAMEKIRETQARLKTPFLVLSGHVQPGQTSDPRSGFATVEKDHTAGSPMLGDKKVEHFLGIKRNTDSGRMGSPRPKKPKI